jgi:ketosteroid isomerase-like protein
MRDTKTQPEKFAAAVGRVDEALRAMWRGNPEPYTALWAHSDQVTLFGALGPAEKGWPKVSQTFRWIGGKFSGEGQSTIERLATGESGDLAYTVGFERRTARLDGGDLEEKTLRVTHIYRRIDDRWLLVHRHADVVQPDPREVSAS